MKLILFNCLLFYCYRFPFSGMYLPSVERFQRDGEGPVRYSMIEQAAHAARPSVRDNVA